MIYDVSVLDGIMNQQPQCATCGSICAKCGTNSNGAQRWRCPICKTARIAPAHGKQKTGPRAIRLFPTKKECRRCQSIHPIEHFQYHPTTRDRRQIYCGRCLTKFGRESYWRNSKPEYNRDAVTENRSCIGCDLEYEASASNRHLYCSPACAARHRVSHGLTNRPEYHIWHLMLRRCEDSSAAGYAHYGGRGIRVCERWRLSLADFIADMGPRPTPQHTIERINNNGNYEPSNCKWATMAEQCRNTRRNRYLEYEGMELCVTDWAIRQGMKPATLLNRLRLGWSLERALTAPIRGAK